MDKHDVNVSNLKKYTEDDIWIQDGSDSVKSSYFIIEFCKYANLTLHFYSFSIKL